jgi:HD-GYP domain-containing protein (c-di-GMP phosphodiesterase class II)
MLTYARSALKKKSPRSANSRDLMAIAGIMRLRDNYTETHGQRVSMYSKRLAIRMGLPSLKVSQISIGGMLHDIGKVCMSDRIFTDRNTHLSKEMMAEVRRHPLNGVMLLKHLDFLKPVLKYILFHHERIDGSGYPFGLKGEDLPLGAQIISVADCFDAITTDRPYKKGKCAEEAFAILRASSDTIFSYALVHTFIADIKENGMVLTEA